MSRHSVYPPGQPIVLRQADNQEMAREEAKYRVHHQYGGVRKVYDSRPMAIPKSTLVKWVDELDKEWQGDFGRLIFCPYCGSTISPLLPYIYKIVHKLFDLNASFYLILLNFVVEEQVVAY